MNRKLLFMLCVSLHYAMAQTRVGNVTPTVATVNIEPGAVTLLHLSPGYTSSIRLPEDISSVVVGNPATFKVEHSESEPRLAFFKPTTSLAAESNALITTKSGQEISLHLVSDGRAANRTRVDFLLEYRQPQSLLISPSAAQTFLISDTKPISLTSAPDVNPSEKKDAKKPTSSFPSAMARKTPRSRYWSTSGARTANHSPLFGSQSFQQAD